MMGGRGPGNSRPPDPFVTKGDRSHLFYTGPVAHHEFKNFELALEVMTMPGSNGGIFVHTRMQGPGSFPTVGYELQVINSNPPVKGNAYVEHKMTGSIYAVRNTWKSPVKDHEWFRYRIKVSGKTIQTFINDVLTCENLLVRFLDPRQELSRCIGRLREAHR